MGPRHRDPECDRLLLERAQVAEAAVVSTVSLGGRYLTWREIAVWQEGRISRIRDALTDLTVAGDALASVAHLHLDGTSDADALRRGIEAWRAAR